MEDECCYRSFIPAHNEALYIGVTIDAVNLCGQASGKPFEVIVVDDALADRTATNIIGNPMARAAHLTDENKSSCRKIIRHFECPSCRTYGKFGSGRLNLRGFVVVPAWLR